MLVTIRKVHRLAPRTRGHRGTPLKEWLESLRSAGKKSICGDDPRTLTRRGTGRAPMKASGAVNAPVRSVQVSIQEQENGMSKKKVIVTPELLDLGKFMKAPVSPAVRANGFIFTGGYVPLDPETGEAVLGSIEDRARRTLDNLRQVLELAGSCLDKSCGSTSSWRTRRTSRA